MILLSKETVINSAAWALESADLDLSFVSATILYLPLASNFKPSQATSKPQHPVKIIIRQKQKQTNVTKLSKEIINKMKRQLMDWEKIFAKDVTDKQLISKIYNPLTQLNEKTQKIQ